MAWRDRAAPASAALCGSRRLPTWPLQRPVARPTGGRHCRSDAPGVCSDLHPHAVRHGHRNPRPNRHPHVDLDPDSDARPRSRMGRSVLPARPPGAQHIGSPRLYPRTGSSAGRAAGARTRAALCRSQLFSAGHRPLGGLHRTAHPRRHHAADVVLAQHSCGRPDRGPAAVGAQPDNSPCPPLRRDPGRHPGSRRPGNLPDRLDRTPRGQCQAPGVAVDTAPARCTVCAALDQRQRSTVELRRRRKHGHTRSQLRSLPARSAGRQPPEQRLSDPRRRRSHVYRTAPLCPPTAAHPLAARHSRCNRPPGRTPSGRLSAGPGRNPADTAEHPGHPPGPVAAGRSQPCPVLGGPD